MTEFIEAEQAKRGVDWMPVSTAPEGIVIQTKIDDLNGVRNEQLLVLNGGLWWFPDRSMYVYYRPTHWKAAR